MWRFHGCRCRCHDWTLPPRDVRDKIEKAALRKIAPGERRKPIYVTDLREALRDLQNSLPPLRPRG